MVVEVTIVNVRNPSTSVESVTPVTENVITTGDIGNKEELNVLEVIGDELEEVLTTSGETEKGLETGGEIVPNAEAVSAISDADVVSAISDADAVSVISAEPPHHRNRKSTVKDIKSKRTKHRHTGNVSTRVKRNSLGRLAKKKRESDLMKRRVSKQHSKENGEAEKEGPQIPQQDEEEDLTNWPGWNQRHHKRHKRRKRRSKRRRLRDGKGRRYRRDRVRRISTDRPWSVYFIIVGLLLAGFSVAGMVLCNHFHQYSSTWASALVILTGVLGIIHRRNYTDKCKNYSYIAASIAAYLSVLVASGLSCNYLTPRMWLMAHSLKNDTRYAPLLHVIPNDLVQWLSWNNPWLCLGLDLGSLLVLILCLVTCTAAILVLHHFWDATHKWTGKFVPYRRPRWFNPMGQVYIAQVVVFMGFISGSVPITQTEASLWSPVWAGAVVISSLLVNTVGVLLIVASLGLMINGLIKDVNITRKTEEGAVLMKEYGLPVDNPNVNNMEYLFETSLVAFSITAIVLVVALLFTFGQIGHMFRFLWPSDNQDVININRDRNTSVVVLVQSTLERVRRRKRRPKIRREITETEDDENQTSHEQPDGDISQQ